MRRISVSVVVLAMATIATLAATAHAQNSVQNNPPETGAEKPLTAPAATTENASDNARFEFNRVGEDFLRLDRVTGQVSRCSQRAVGWSCQPVPDERTALENEIARLQDENAALKRQVADASPGTAAKPGTKTDPKGYRVPDAQWRLPTNEDIDHAMAEIGKVWKRLMRILNDARSDMAEKI